MKCTYGTGAFILLNTGESPLISKNSPITTVAYQTEKKTLYALEGNCYIAGAAVQWLRDNLELFAKAPDVEKLARSVGPSFEKIRDEMKNVLFFPFFSGLGAPYWRPEGTGAIIGLTRDTNRGHLARAALEGIALSINDLVEAMRSDTGIALDSLHVDGGAVSNNLLLELQASFSKLTTVRPKVIETTAYGAALAALLGAKLASFKDIENLWEKDQAFFPIEDEYFLRKKALWRGFIKRHYL